jgi:hypothetical protein
VERYDPATDRWFPGPPLNTPRFGHTATLLADGRLLVVGGVGFAEAGHITLPDAERYDPPSAVPTSGATSAAHSDAPLAAAPAQPQPGAADAAPRLRGPRRRDRGGRNRCDRPPHAGGPGLASR